MIHKLYNPQKVESSFLHDRHGRHGGGVPHLRPKVHFHESGPTWTEKRCIKHLGEDRIWNWFEYDKRKCTQLFITANNYHSSWWLDHPSGRICWLVKLDHFPNFGGENKKHLKPPPRNLFLYHIQYNIYSTLTMATETYANSDLGVVPWCKHVIGVCGKNMLICISTHFS